MKIFELTKAVLRIQNNPKQFLNGLTSNSMDKPRNAFLNIHGRIIAVFDQIMISDEEAWIVLENQYVNNVLAHIDRYVKLAGVKVEQLNDKVYLDLEGNDEINEEELTIPQKMGRMIITRKERRSTISCEEFTLFRLDNNLPVQGIDFKDEMILNVSMDEFVSFTKGCYLGQEPVSKVYNRSKPTWILTVKYEDECGDEEKGKMTSKVLEPATGKIKGFVFVRNK